MKVLEPTSSLSVSVPVTVVVPVTVREVCFKSNITPFPTVSVFPTLNEVAEAEPFKVPFTTTFSSAFAGLTSMVIVTPLTTVTMELAVKTFCPG